MDIKGRCSFIGFVAQIQNRSQWVFGHARHDYIQRVVYKKQQTGHILHIQSKSLDNIAYVKTPEKDLLSISVLCHHCLFNNE